MLGSYKSPLHMHLDLIDAV